MIQTCENFKKYLDEKDIKYRESDENAVILSFGGENINTVSIVVIFDEDGLSVALRAFSVCTIPQDKLMQFYVLVNELNSQYRWVKFCIDKDNEINVEDDAVLDADSSSEECFELLMRALNIIDDTYPKFMKILWG